MGNSLLANQILEKSFGNASSMTHALANAGKGKMGAGIRELLNIGHRDGVIKGVTITSLLFSLGVGAGALVLHRYYETKLNKIEQETMDSCFEFASAVYDKKCEKCNLTRNRSESNTITSETN